MIKLTLGYEELVVALFIGPILLVAIYNIIVFAKRDGVRIFNKYKDFYIFKKKMKEVERKKKEEGFLHEWVTVKHPFAGEVTVCKASGFCPSLYGFFEVGWIKRYLEGEKHMESVVNERNAFFDKRLNEISSEYGLKAETIEAIADKVLSISKDFTVSKLGKLQDDLKSKDV
jgi:hypothetical protein